MYYLFKGENKLLVKDDHQICFVHTGFDFYSNS